MPRSQPDKHDGGYGTVRTGDGPSGGTGGRGAHTGRPEPGALAPVAAAPEALVVSVGWQIEGLPATIRRAGPQAAERTVEFFTAQIRNPHTRAAYAAAVTRFFTWCDARGLALAQISPIAVATYIEEMHSRYRAPTFKQHLAAIRRLFDWLVTGHFRHAGNVTPDTRTGLSPRPGIAVSDDPARACIGFFGWFRPGGSHNRASVNRAV